MMSADIDSPSPQSLDRDANHPGVTIALLGNPNTGKSTLFNALTGVHQQTGNYPGVTVEKRIGQLSIDSTRIEIVDLPGTYSLSANSPDEQVAVDVLLGRQKLHSGEAASTPDLIVAVVDASNLRRNMFLISQLLELNQPLIMVLNMTDVAARSGHEIDAVGLRAALGCDVIPVQANKRIGIEQLKAVIAQQLSAPRISTTQPTYPADVSELIDKQQSAVDQTESRRFVAVRKVFDEELAADLSDAHGPAAELESRLRYQWIDSTIASCVSQSSKKTSAAFRPR